LQEEENLESHELSRGRRTSFGESKRLKESLKRKKEQTKKRGEGRR